MWSVGSTDKLEDDLRKGQEKVAAARYRPSSIRDQVKRIFDMEALARIEREKPHVGYQIGSHIIAPLGMQLMGNSGEPSTDICVLTS